LTGVLPSSFLCCQTSKFGFIAQNQPPKGPGAGEGILSIYYMPGTGQGALDFILTLSLNAFAHSHGLCIVIPELQSAALGCAEPLTLCEFCVYRNVF